MYTTLTLRRTGGSIAATLPKEQAERLKLEPGDQIFAIETERGILLTPYDPAFSDAMDHYARGAKKYRNALRELAK